jgi:integrase
MPLTLYPRGDTWHYRGTLGGKRLRGSTKTKSKETAERVIHELESRFWKGRFDGPSSILTFAYAAQLYRQAEKPERFLRKIEDFWKDTPVKQMTAGAIRQSAFILEPNSCGATRNRHVIVPTQAIINHAAEQDLCARIRVKRFPVVKRERKHASREWIEAFMAHASPHLGALACFMFSTGARISEAINVRWADVDLTGQTVLIRQTKIGDERRAHIPGRLLVAMANITGERNATGKVFKYSTRNTCQPNWFAAIRRAGIPRLTFHACRHGFATAALQAGIDVRTVAELGGWKTPALVLSTYGHAVKDKTLTERLFDTADVKSAIVSNR